MVSEDMKMFVAIRTQRSSHVSGMRHVGCKRRIVKITITIYHCSGFELKIDECIEQRGLSCKKKYCLKTYGASFCKEQLEV